MTIIIDRLLIVITITIIITVKIIITIIIIIIIIYEHMSFQKAKRRLIIFYLWMI